MIHTFSFKYGSDTLYYLWDVESGSLHNVDYTALLCTKKSYNLIMTDKEQADYLLIDHSILAEIQQELQELEAMGALNASQQVSDFHKSADTLKALCLHICHDCNLKCDYCFASGGTYNTERDYMSLDVGKKAVDLLISKSGNRKNLEIDFFGGEPLMNLNVVKGIVDYAKEQAIIYSKKFSFTMTTNCLLLNDANSEYLNREMDNVVLSIDGRKCTHNNVRHSISGVDCYDTILKNAVNFKTIRGEKKYYVRGTFTSANLDFASDVLELNDLGFDQISVEPVVLPESSPLAIKDEHLQIISDEYEKLSNHYISRRKSGKWFNFFHYMIDLQNGPCITKRLTGCGAGTEYLAISPVGEIYPCHQFVGINEFLIGDVFNGIQKQSIREHFAQISLLKKESCTNCFAKYYCGGGCAANAYNFNGSIESVYKFGCNLTRKRLEQSLAIAALEKKD